MWRTNTLTLNAFKLLPRTPNSCQFSCTPAGTIRGLTVTISVTKYSLEMALRKLCPLQYINTAFPAYSLVLSSEQEVHYNMTIEPISDRCILTSILYSIFIVLRLFRCSQWKRRRREQDQPLKSKLACLCQRQYSCSPLFRHLRNVTYSIDTSS